MWGFWIMLYIMFETQIYMIRIYKRIVFHMFTCLLYFFYQMILYFMSYVTWTMFYVELFWLCLWNWVVYGRTLYKTVPFRIGNSIRLPAIRPAIYSVLLRAGNGQTSWVCLWIKQAKSFWFYESVALFGKIGLIYGSKPSDTGWRNCESIRWTAR